MTYDAGPTVTFHRTDKGHLAARLEEYAMIAFPASDDLICFCRPKLCHGNLLSRLAHATREERVAWWRGIKAAN